MQMPQSIVWKTTTLEPAELSIWPYGHRNYPNDGHYIVALGAGLLTQASVIKLTTMISSISTPIPPWSSRVNAMKDALLMSRSENT